MTDSGNGDPRPISAVAAAKLESNYPGRKEAIQEAPHSLSSDGVDSEYPEQEPGQEEQETLRNVQLCTWRYGPNYVSSESDEQLTISLEKNTTVALIGHFDFFVLKGAININGANFGVKALNGYSIHQACVPSTHPISNIRGLDSRNEVRFSDCSSPSPFTNISPLFADIWTADSGSLKTKSFALVGNHALFSLFFNTCE